MEAYEELYEMIYKILRTDFEAGLIQPAPNIRIVNSLDDIKLTDTAIMGGDVGRQEVRKRLSANSPTIYIHRGYLGNHLYKRRKWWRYSVNDFANTKINTIPYSRWHLLGLPKHPWKVKEVKNVLIAPSKLTTHIWTPNMAKTWIDWISDQFPGAEVKVRYKGRRPGTRWLTLWSDFDWADLVVSQASAITAEAFYYGKKVISTHPCITWASYKAKLEDWQDPTEPKNRDIWLEHLAWSQFQNEEWSSNSALNLIEKYYGDITQYKSNFNYTFA